MFADSNWAILENETTREFNDLVLPDFLSVVDVKQNNDELYNRNIAVQRRLVPKK